MDKKMDAKLMAYARALSCHSCMMEGCNGILEVHEYQLEIEGRWATRIDINCTKCDPPWLLRVTIWEDEHGYSQSDSP